MSSLIIASASRSSPRISIYHSSHIILISSSFHFIIFVFFTFPLIHFTMVLFAISSKLIFTHFIYHTLLFTIPSSFPSYFTSITLITTHLCFSFSIASMFFMHPFPYIPIPFFLSATSNTLTLIHFHSNPLIPLHCIITIHFLFLFLTPYYHAFSDTTPLHYPSLSFISSISILIPLSAILHIPFISFLRFPLSCLIYEISIMFVRLVVIPCPFVVLIGNTRCQLDVIAFASDGWIESISIDWWGNVRMNTWRLNGIGVVEAVRIEVDSIRC